MYIQPTNNTNLAIFTNYKYFLEKNITNCLENLQTNLQTHTLILTHIHRKFINLHNFKC